MLWRVLGISAATLILGMGGLLAYNLVTPPAPAGAAKPIQAAATTPSPPASSQTPALSAPAAPAPSATAKLAQTTPPRRIAEAGHGQSALKVASLLGGGGETVALPIPEAGPTPADFSRPAFLEPLDDADAAATAARGETVAETKPAAEAAPLPAPRPVKMASADAAASDADAAETARIRSAVTMRSGPRRSASPIGTLEAGTKVKLYSCKSWCEVSTGDKRGWVYKSSVDR
ncbi:SH3 domain-containing protein [Xanthobacter wiegelii]|uniref:SH3 domain-containing protein n=1 Tax=Xanthobacter wiegelii TaxID=3119913 RepID=UPI003728BFED